MTGSVYRKGGRKLSAFPYPGGKTSYVEEIIHHFPDHRRYVEPFGGSAAVLLNKPESYIEVFNDQNSDIVHFFEVLRERREELVDWLRRTPFSRELHEEWARSLYSGERPEDDIERAGRWFYLRYTQWGGKIDRYSGFKTSLKRNEARSFRGSIEHLEAIVDRLQDVILENQDYQQILDRYDREDTLFYLDPPYLETRYDYYGGEGFDHSGFVDELPSLEGYWIVSYGVLPKGIREIADTVLEFTAHYSLDVREGEERDESAEHLLMNFDPREETPFNGNHELGAFSRGNNR